MSPFDEAAKAMLGDRVDTREDIIEPRRSKVARRDIGDVLRTDRGGRLRRSSLVSEQDHLNAVERRPTLESVTLNRRRLAGKCFRDREQRDHERASRNERTSPSTTTSPAIRRPCFRAACSSCCTRDIRTVGVLAVITRRDLDMRSSCVEPLAMKRHAGGVGSEQRVESQIDLWQHVEQRTRHHDVVAVERSRLEYVLPQEGPFRPPLARHRENFIGVVGTDVIESPGPPPVEELAVGAGTSADVENPRRPRQRWVGDQVEQRARETRHREQRPQGWRVADR